jgi:hypothetical protein
MTAAETSRRAAIGAILAAGTVAATALPALGAALPSIDMAAPAALAAEAPTASAPTNEAEGLMEIGRRLPDLLNEFWDANAALKDARARFDESAPLPPKWRKRANDANRLLGRPMFKIVRGTPATFVAAPWEVSASHAYEALWDALLRGETNQFTRKEFYQVSDRFFWKLIWAANDCGLNNARTRFREASYELREVAAQAFDFKPQTRPGIAAQAFALYGATEAKDGRVGSKFAASLAANVLVVEASHGDMSAMLGVEGAEQCGSSPV